MKQTMKYLVIIMIWSNLYSCNKDNKTELNNVSSEEAAEIIAASLSSDNGGTTAQFGDAAELSEKINTLKGTNEEVFDTSFTVSSKDGARITFEYTFHYQYGINYNTNSGKFEFYTNFDTDGFLESQKINMVNNSLGNLTLTGLEQNEDYYVISGSASGNGNQTTNIKNEKTIKSTISLTFKDIKIQKSDHRIESGSGTVTISGKTSEGNDFSFTGTLIYKSDGTIILTINGKEYTVNTGSGEIA